MTKARKPKPAKPTKPRKPKPLIQVKTPARDAITPWAFACLMLAGLIILSWYVGVEIAKHETEAMREPEAVAAAPMPVPAHHPNSSTETDKLNRAEAAKHPAPQKCTAYQVIEPGVTRCVAWGAE